MLQNILEHACNITVLTQTN